MVKCQDRLQRCINYAIKYSEFKSLTDTNNRMISILVSMVFFVFVLVYVNLCVCEFVCVERTAKKMVGANCLLLVSRKNGWLDEPKIG